MEISLELIKTLRAETGVSIAKCKEALDEAGGDIEKARTILSSYSASASEKKADRELGAGIIASYVHSSKLLGSLLELNCETDFVAKHEDFITLANDIAMHAAAMSSALETIMDESFIKNPDIKISDLIATGTQKLGERITIRRISRFQVLD